MHRLLRAVVIVGAVALVSGCARHYSGGATYADPYGFFSGIWHGLIFPYSVIANIISWLLALIGVDFLSEVQIIGRPNTGFLFYYLGFLFGLSVYSSVGRQRPRPASGTYEA